MSVGLSVRVLVKMLIRVVVRVSAGETKSNGKTSIMVPLGSLGVKSEVEENGGLSLVQVLPFGQHPGLPSTTAR